MQASRAASVVSVGIAGYSVFGYKSSHVKSPAPVPSRIAEIFWSNESAISGFALVNALHRLTEAFSSEVEFVSSANLWGISCSTLMKLVCTTPFHPCLSEAVDLRGAARKLLFVHGVRFAALLGIGGGGNHGALGPRCGQGEPDHGYGPDLSSRHGRPRPVRLL